MLKLVFFSRKSSNFLGCAHWKKQWSSSSTSCRTIWNWDNETLNFYVYFFEKYVVIKWFKILKKDIIVGQTSKLKFPLWSKWHHISNFYSVCDSKQRKIFESLFQLIRGWGHQTSCAGIILNLIDKIISKNCFPASNWPQQRPSRWTSQKWSLLPSKC